MTSGIFRLRSCGDHLALVDPADGSSGARLSHEAVLGWLVIIGSIPVAVVGLLFKKQIEGTFTKNLWVIATMMVVIAVLLAIAELVGQKAAQMQDLSLKDALVDRLRAVPGADSRIEPFRLDDHGRSVCRRSARNCRAIFVPAFDSGDCRERPAGIERGSS